MSLPSLHWRYAVKRFDPNRIIAPEIWQQLEQSLILTPSSFGLQPWRFIVVLSEEFKGQLPAASWNQSQPKDCSHMVVFAARRHIPDAYVDEFLQSVSDVRGVSTETLNGYRNVILGFLNNRQDRHFEWATNQVYIALGQLMATAAHLEVDACPMEGMDAVEYDRILGLSDSEYGTVVGCALGYRHAEDRYAQAKKVRFTKDRVIEYR